MWLRKQTCHVPGTGMAYVILRVGVRECTERRFAFLSVYARALCMVEPSFLCAQQLAQGIYVISDRSSCCTSFRIMLHVLLSCFAVSAHMLWVYSVRISACGSLSMHHGFNRRVFECKRLRFSGEEGRTTKRESPSCFRDREGKGRMIEKAKTKGPSKAICTVC